MRLSNLHKTYLAITLINAGDGIISTILPPFLEDSGQDVASIGFIVSTFAVLSLVSRMPAGLAYKPRYASAMMRLSLAIFALSLPFYSLTRDATSITLARAVGGFSFGAATTLNMAVFMDHLTSASNRARAMAFYTAAMSAGFAIGNSVGGWFVDSLGYDWAFRLAAVSPVLAAVFSVNADGQERNVAADPTKRSGWVGEMRSALRYVWSGPILIIALLAFSLNANHHLMSTFFPLYATSIGFSLTSIGLLRGIHSVFGTVTRPLSGEATRVASHDLLANGGLAFLALLVALIPSFRSMAAFIPLFIVLGTARGIVMVSNTISLAAESGDDPRKRGVASGIFNTAKDLGSVFGPIFGGTLAGYMGIENMLRIGPFSLVLVYFLAFGTVVRGRAARPEVESVEIESGHS